MTLSLPKDLDQFVNQLVESGLYPCAEDAICDGLRLLKDQEELRKIRLAELRKEVAVGLEQLERGQYKAYDESTLHQLRDELVAEIQEERTEQPSQAQP